MPEPERRRPVRWRPWLRALHRDIGYVAVGLTFVYALSGLAVNHIADWDPNFDNYEARHQVAVPLPEDDHAAADKVLAELALTGPPTEVYRSDARELSILLDGSTLHVDLDSGVVLEDGQRPRLLLRIANWLHLNRGKKAWTYIADGYAVFLLFLAASGLFMLPGRKGLVGRGGVLVLLGIAVPVLYVTLSGGP
ncbi:hypothetical protein [Nannocystis pusilla]|uniref:hypothetical protein n=1 Tax=Nannocystis pusilla TaxID=889268 RepID=UPI003B813A18